MQHRHTHAVYSDFLLQNITANKRIVSFHEVRFCSSSLKQSFLFSSPSFILSVSPFSLCSTSVCRALCVLWLQHLQLTAAPVALIHLWLRAHGSCLRAHTLRHNPQHTHRSSASRRKLSLRTCLHIQTEVMTVTKCLTHAVTHTLTTSSWREACAHRMRR